MNVTIPDIACYYPKRDVVVPPLLTQTHVIPPKRVRTAATPASAADAESASDDDDAAAAYGGRTIRVLMVTSASSIADASSDSIKVERMHHNYAVEKWLIELYTSHAAAIYGWKVNFQGDSEEAGGVRGDASETTAAAAAAGAASGAAAGDSAAAVAPAAGDGAAAGVDSEWGESVFCLVLPGRAQWTVQLAKAILSGCIPVTFLRANDNPWAASLYRHKAAAAAAAAASPSATPSATASPPSALNYPVFSLNIDPADLNSLPRRLQEAFDRPGLVARLQHNLGLVQDMFKWHDSLDRGAGEMLMSRLRRIGAAAAAQSHARRDLESRGLSPTSAAVLAARDSQLLPAATIGSVSAFSGSGDDGAGAGGNDKDAAGDDNNRPFIYVYDTQSEWTEGMKERKKEWFSDQYEVESVLTELLMRSNAIRTTDPEKATLFYVPYFSSNHLAHVNKNEKNMMDKAVGEVSKAWHEILTMIRSDFPYFNRTNGRDHFGTSTFDQGRCHALTWVNPDLYGEMFFVMLNGDRLARTIHASVQRNLQVGRGTCR
ncbi:unnamed protein product [Closterium sp. Naga37s-1]|nr:unnamed protein product [Closterium sp. Naga37s-1]